MRLTFSDELPLVSVRVTYASKDLEIADLLLDTGSATTVLSAEVASQIGIIPQMDDVLHTMRGIGGTEAVFVRQVNRIAIDGHGLDNFEVQIAGMDYGFSINGIVGVDFLLPLGAVINLRSLELRFSE